MSALMLSLGFQPVFHRMLLTETGASGAPEQIVKVVKGSVRSKSRLLRWSRLCPMLQIQGQIVEVINVF